MQSLTSAQTAIRVDVQQAIRRALQTFARVSLGLIFFLAGLDGFIDVLPHPSKPLPERALLFAGALLKSGYFLPMLKGTELIAGAVFLSNHLVPLAVVIIAPIVVNIFAFHLFLAPDGLALAVILVALEAHLAWTYRPPLSANPCHAGRRRRLLSSLRAGPSSCASGPDDRVSAVAGARQGHRLSDAVGKR